MFWVFGLSCEYRYRRSHDASRQPRENQYRLKHHSVPRSQPRLVSRIAPVSEDAGHAGHSVVKCLMRPLGTGLS